jgi:hypothetical protein
VERRLSLSTTIRVAIEVENMESEKYIDIDYGLHKQEQVTARTEGKIK